MRAVAVPEVLQPHRVLTRALARREPERQRALVALELDDFHLVELLDAALHRARLGGLGAKAANEALGLLALARKVRRAALQNLELLGARRDVLLVVPGILAHVLALERHRAADLLVQELAVVADQQECAVPARQER